MITDSIEYFANLAYIQDHNFPYQVALEPTETNSYQVNLSERKIIGPRYLSVETDHKAETVYFIVDRFFDYMDLARTTCVVQYINAKNESHYYVVPFYDCLSLLDKNKMIVPWNIDGSATIAPGTVKFNLRFYKIENNEFVYNLTTQTALAEVLHGMKAKNFKPEDYNMPIGENSAYLQLISAINALNKAVSDKLYWLTPDAPESEDEINAEVRQRQEDIAKIFGEALELSEV